MKHMIYLDYAAATPMDESVFFDDEALLYRTVF